MHEVFEWHAERRPKLRLCGRYLYGAGYQGL